MSELRDVQAEFVAALFNPKRSPPAEVTSHSGHTPTRRFSVYRNNVFASLADVLQAYFPVVTRLVGEEFFRAVAHAYVRADPPRSPILSQYGGNFPAFISRFEPVRDLPYLADVARLEWLQQRAYHSADRTPLSASDLEQIPARCAADVVLELHPSASVMASPFPIVSIWNTNAHDAEVIPISLEAGGEAALVLRPALDVKVIQLPEGTQAFVRALRARVALAEAAAYALGREKTFNFQLTFAGLIDAGAFAAFEVRQTHRSNDRQTLGANVLLRGHIKTEDGP